MSSLRELQARFAAALRSGAGAEELAVARADLTPDSCLEVYRSSVAAACEGALARSFPVLRRRVGGPYFAALAAAYRAAHPSRSGDLHWLGREFAAFLERHFEGGPYAWLADLARLEWACEEALVLAHRPSVGTQALAGVAPERWAQCRLRLQPSTRCIVSHYPVFSVWQRNQHGEGPAVKLEDGGECIVLRAADEGVSLHRCGAAECDLTAALAGGAPLGDALEHSGLDAQALTHTLAWLFGAEFVIEVVLPRDGVAQT